LAVVHDDETLARDVGNEKISGARKLLAAADTDPLARENPFALELERPR
jgi:hypothetical protein